MPKADNAAITSVNPATQEINAEIPVTAAEEVCGIAAGAREAQKKWAALGVRGRLPYFNKLRDYIMSHTDEIARTITLDNGKTLIEAMTAEILPVLDMIQFCMNEAPRALNDEKLHHPLFRFARISSRNIFEPLGVVAIISPWNFPFAISVTQTLMALVTGNAVLLKPAALTALVGRMTEKIFRETGFPDGMFNVIQGSGGVLGDAILNAGVDRVAFTGSVEVGRHLMGRAAERLTPITLELGGKDPFIVLDDADIERASSGAVWGAFVNAGQVCASVERVYVHEKVAKQFISLVEQKVKRLRVGDGLDFGTDMGPMISGDQMSIVESHVADAVAKGANVIAGGARVPSLPGNFFQPTVLTGVDHSMRCMNEETFGPTMPIMTFSNIEEALALANDCKFALTASVWSRNIERAEQVARKIETGTATVNDCSFTYGFAVCPWGGPKDSGIGRTHSVHGLYEFTNIKNLTTTVPLMKNNLWWYPYSKKKYGTLKGLMNALYGDSLAAKCAGISSLLKK